LGLVGLAFAASLQDRCAAWLAHPVWGRLRETGLARRLCEFQGKYALYRRKGTTLAAFSVLTLLEQSLTIVYVWLVAVTLHVDATLLVVAGALPLALLISRVPVAIGGVGVLDGAFMLLLTSAGVPPADAIAITLLLRLLEALTWLPWWIAGALKLGTLRPPRLTSPVV
jgi:uncharacterized protein (TIRG00374 family)